MYWQTHFPSHCLVITVAITWPQAPQLFPHY